VMPGMEVDSDGGGEGGQPPPVAPGS